MDCRCHTCRSACEHKPGWFAPGEAEQAAELLGLTLQEFFDDYLAVDYQESTREGEEAVFVLSPAVVGNLTGTEYPSEPHGRCVFFQNDLCMIHRAKPSECAIFDHTVPIEVAHSHRTRMLNEWRAHKDQIRQLLGRDPVILEPDLMESLRASLAASYRRFLRR